VQKKKDKNAEEFFCFTRFWLFSSSAQVCF